MGTPTSSYMKSLPRFLGVAKYLQMPKVDLVGKFTQDKGSPLTDFEKAELKLRADYAKLWLENYAPEDFKYLPSEEIPQEVFDLSEKQKKLLGKVADILGQKEWEAEELQNAIYQMGKEMGLGAKETFGAIYISLLGKDHGPKAAWLVLDLDRDFVANRFKQASEVGGELAEKKEKPSDIPVIKDSSLASIDPGLFKRYPSLKMGIVLVRGVKVEVGVKGLDGFRQGILENHRLSIEEVNRSSVIQSYRKIFREMGIDWHSRRPTGEALLRRIAQGKEFPAVNNVIDVGNLAVFKNHLSCGVFDLKKVDFPIVLKAVSGQETVKLIGSNEETILKDGEICYFDQKGPFAIDLCYRDIVRTSVDPKTTDLLLLTEGVFEISELQVGQMLKDLMDLIQRFCGGKIEKFGIVR